MPTTKTSWLNSYNTHQGNDEMYSLNDEVKPYWNKLFKEFDKLAVNIF